MYQNVKRTRRAIVFAHETYCFAALSLPPSSLLKLPSIPRARIGYGMIYVYECENI